jgi:hypothetical protein
MTHKLKITNGAKILAASLLTIPEQFTTPSEIIRASHLHESLISGFNGEQDAEYASKEIEFDVSEPQRDMLKVAVTANAKRIPLSPHSVSLLTALGFE